MSLKIDAGWVTAGVELVGIVIAFFLGRKQGRDTERTYQLSLRQATPHVCSRVEFIQGIPASQGHQFRYSIKTTVYNDGSLVATKLEGNWKLSSSYGFLDATEVIRADSLPATLPWEREHDLRYHLPNTWTKPEVTLKVDIDLVYLGIGGRQEKYHATYELDTKSGRMIQVI